MKIFITSIFLYFTLSGSSFALIKHPISSSYTYDFMTELGLLGQEGWLIDRRESLQVLREILETLERYPGADYQKVTMEINRIRQTQSLPYVDEDFVHRLMYEAGLLGDKEQSTISEDEEILQEIRSILEWYPDASYLRVTAEINRIRLIEENPHIIFWPRIYRIMKKNSLLVNEDAFVFEEIQQILGRHNQLGVNLVTEMINITRYNKNQKPVEWDQVYRLMHQAGLLKKRLKFSDKKEDAELLAEIKDILADYREVNLTVNVGIITGEINRRRSKQSLQSGKNVKTVNKDRVYRIMQEAGLLEQEEQINISEDELLLNEIIKVLEQNPNYDYKAVTAEINSTRPTHLQVSEDHIQNLMQEVGLLEQTKPSIDETEYNEIDQEIINTLEQNLVASYLELTMKINLAHSSNKNRQPISNAKRIQTLKDKQGIEREKKPVTKEKYAWLLEEILRILSIEEYSNYGYKKVTIEINRNLSPENQVNSETVHRIMKKYNLAGSRKRPMTQEEFAKVREEAGIINKEVAVGSVVLLAAAGTAEQGYAQDHITSENGEPETFTAETDPLLEINEFTAGITPYTEEISPEITEEMISEMDELTGEFVEILADGAPLGIGTVISGFSLVTGKHLITGRPLTPFERGEAVIWMAFSLLPGAGYLKAAIKVPKFSKGMKVFNTINGKQFNKVMSLLVKGKIEKAKELFASFLRSTGSIKQKIKPTRSRKKVVVEEGGYSTDEVAKTFVLSGDFNQIKPGQVHEAVNFHTVFDPRHGRVFVQTPDGNKIPLDFYNPGVSKLLRHIDTLQGQALESLIKNRARTSVRPSDFSDLVLH